MNKTTSIIPGSIELVVSPEQMYATASLIENNIGTARIEFNSMLSDIKATSYWEGAAADKERARFENESDNFAALISNLTNYVAELKQITGIYEMSEQISAVEAQSLMSDILD